MFNFSKASLDKMNGVDSKLVNLMKEAIKDSPYDFGITEGIRTLERQKELFAQGKTKTLKSYHLVGKAVDVKVYVNGEITWDFKYYKEVADHIKEVAKKLGYVITWGGDWKKFKDGPHFQIED
ncbi:M15 family metallopeptidase [Fusobacterium periodonticum]|jgi:endolysin|uniref:M15 family metallopeptidase n=1 Tax=Fusobacterium periodonticum TaxID=860 RepID=UPI00352C15EC